MLFPQLGPQYYDEKDRSILSRMEAAYAEAVTINQAYWGEADTDKLYVRIKSSLIDSEICYADNEAEGASRRERLSEKTPYGDATV